MYISTNDMSELLLATLVNDDVFTTGTGGDDRLYFTEPFIYKEEIWDFATYENIMPYIQQLGLMANVSIRFQINNAEGNIEASLHHLRNKVTFEGETIDLSDEEALDKLAKTKGFRSWQHIPNGALKGTWVDPDPFTTFGGEDIVRMNMLICHTLITMMDFANAA